MNMYMLLRVVVLAVCLQIVCGCDRWTNQQSVIAAEIALIDKELAFYKRHTDLLQEIVANMEDIQKERPLSEVEERVLDSARTRVQTFSESMKSLTLARSVLSQSQE